MNTKRYESVRDLARDTGGDEAVAAMERAAAATELVTRLARMRGERELTMRDLGKRIGWSTSKVSRFESSTDADLRVGEVRQYLGGLGVSMTARFHDPATPAAQRIKDSVFSIHDDLEALAALANTVCDDRTLADGIYRFYGEVLFNFLARFGDSYSKLPSFSLTAPACPEAVPAKAVTEASPPVAVAIP